jgi:hypothetical protein
MTPERKEALDRRYAAAIVGADMTPERKESLDRRYAAAIVGKSQEATQHEWLKYLAVLYKEDGNHKIFLALRVKSRNAAAKVITKYLEDKIGDRQLYQQITEVGQDQYARDLNTYGLANIDLSSEWYKTFTDDMALEVLQACKNWKEGVCDICDVRSRVWHRYIDMMHKLQGLPDVATMRDAVGWSSVDEKAMIDSNDYETKMTAEEKADWKTRVETV